MGSLTTNSVRIDRDDLAGFLPNLRAIKAFENLQSAVATDIPDAVNSNTDAIENLDVTAQEAVAQAARAHGAADMVAAALDRLTAAILTQRNYGATIARMQQQIDDLQSTILGS